MIDILVVSHACLTAINRRPWRRMAAMGWNIEVVTAEALDTADLVRPADPPAADDPPMHFLRVGGPNLRLWRFSGLRRVIAERQPRIVMIDYDPGTLITLQVGSATIGGTARVACLAYDNIYRNVTGEMRASAAAGARAAGTLLMSRMARRFVDHVFVLSGDSADVMRNFGFDGRITQIPLGYEPSLFRPDDAGRQRIRARLRLRETTVAYFGRLVPEKGMHTLLEALNRLRDRPWQLLLDRFSEYKHPYTQHVTELIKQLGLEDRIVYFDASHDEMGGYMNAADIVVMPSRSAPGWKEQYGRVAAEAMACGKTVVVSTCGALPELVGDAGVVLPESELGNLHEVLAQLLADPARRSSIGERAAVRAAERLSMQVQVRLMHERFAQWALPSRQPQAEIGDDL